MPIKKKIKKTRNVPVNFIYHFTVEWFLTSLCWTFEAYEPSNFLERVCQLGVKNYGTISVVGIPSESIRKKNRDTFFLLMLQIEPNYPFLDKIYWEIDFPKQNQSNLWFFIFLPQKVHFWRFLRGHKLPVGPKPNCEPENGTLFAFVISQKGTSR